jgi:peptidoglycan hydrolase CwlO-like protein
MTVTSFIIVSTILIMILVIVGVLIVISVILSDRYRSYQAEYQEFLQRRSHVQDEIDRKD